MTHWQKIDELFQACLERSAEGREALLQQEEPWIRKEVELLLEDCEAADSFIDAALNETLPGLVEGATTELETPALEGEHIGQYRIVREMGRGGMAVVYLAERADGAFEQQVALKLLKRGMDTDEILRRFLYERQVLASLNHPNIAGLIDGGATSDGRPYFIMEYVEGAPITDFCEQRRLGAAERLALVMTVARTVQHAHSNLIIHRDIKPSNVFVTENGDVKLLDFGVAKLLDERTWSVDTPATRAGRSWITPEYASPEQLNEEAITTASDVYQLGLLAEELLAERPPRGDLDMIVAKARHEDPELRYASAETMADDVERYLAGQPVVARAPTSTYRVRKFVERNSRAVAATTAVLLLFIGMVAFYTHRLAGERDRAQSQAEKAEQVSGFLTSLFQVTDPESGPDSSITAKTLLDLGASRIHSDLAGHPVVQARLLNVIAVAYRNRGFNEESLQLLRRALAVAEGSGIPPLEMADYLNNIGEVLYYLGHYEEAESHYEESLALRRRRLGAKHVDVAQSLNNLALIDLHQDDLAEGEDRMRRGLAIFQAAFEGDHWRVANAKNVLAQALIPQERLSEARVLCESAIAMHRRLRGEEQYKLALMAARNTYATVLCKMGEPRVAEAVHREVLQRFDSLLPTYHYFKVEALVGLGHALREQEQYEEAEAVFQQALDHQRHTLREEDPRRANAMVGLARVFMETERELQADSLLRRALQLQEAALPEGHRKVEEVRVLLAKRSSSL